MVNIKLRKPCNNCGCLMGSFVATNGQCVVRCNICERYQYNAPKSETGRQTRSVESRQGIKPSKRARILERANGRCEICGRSPAEHNIVLVLGHVLSVDEGKKLKFTDDVLNSDDNLISSCEECNLGQGRRSYPASILLGLVKARLERNG